MAPADPVVADRPSAAYDGGPYAARAARRSRCVLGVHRRMGRLHATMRRPVGRKSSTVATQAQPASHSSFLPIVRWEAHDPAPVPESRETPRKIGALKATGA